MSRHTALLSLFLLPALFPVACGTGVVGIEQCRAIEEARCEAAASCGKVDDVDACKRFYRDHCLHGLEGAKPNGDEETDCIEAIRSAGECARSEGAEASPSSCPDGAPTKLRADGDRKPFADVCDIVDRPWDSQACTFLTPAVDDEGAGGAGGAGE
jgi:hypothetical protein